MALDKIRSTVKYPTTLIINGCTSSLAIELADSLLEQGGYVIIVDNTTEENIRKIDSLGANNLLTFIDHSELITFSEQIRRLDYVFYFGHESVDLTKEISTQKFLDYSNFLDNVMELNMKFEAKFMLTTSVKAHQMVMANKETDFNYGASTSAKKHSVYTEMELQRYAESLVIEYIEKAEADARIIRIAEIIGDGMDFLANTSFTKMVLAAVKGEKIPVYKDGLNSEWYVHILDAVYGLIKAQFSRNTLGKIFTLSYEDSYSDLSIAYKIHDLEPEAGEVDFVDDTEIGGNLPPLKLYKPAQNLSKIGWKPKVEIEEAMEQSLAGAKLFLAEKTAKSIVKNGQRSDGTSKGKLISFLQIAKSSEDKDDSELTPLDKLLEERKQQDENKSTNISTANKKIKIRNKNRDSGEKSIFSPVSNLLWGVFLYFRKSFSFLGDMTPTQFVFWVVFLSVFFTLYFTVISPAVVLARNYFLADQYIDSITVSLDQKDFTAMNYSLKELDQLILETTRIASSYQWLADTLGIEEEYRNVINLLDTYQVYVSGMQSLAESLSPLSEYMDVYTDSTFFRPNSESYLSIETSYDYSDYLNPLKNNQGLALAGEQKVESAIKRLGQINTNQFPTAMSEYFRGINDKIYSSSRFAEYSSYVSLIPDVFGVGETKTYLFLLLDNSRFTPAGGEISAYALVSVQNGSISQVRVQSVNEINLDTSQLEDIYKSISDDFTFSTTGEQVFDANDISSIAFDSDFSSAAKQLWEYSFNRRIDGVITLNYSGLQEYISQIESIDGVDISVEGVQFNGINLLNNLNLIQSQNQTLSRRNDIAAQLFAVVLDQSFSNISTNLINFTDSLRYFSSKKDLRVSLYFVEDLNTENDKELVRSDSYFRPFLNSDDRIINTDKFPSVNYATQVQLADDGNLIYFFKARFPAINNIDEFGLCLPVNATDIQPIGVDAGRYIFTDNLDERCIIANITGETEISFSWRLLSVASLSDSEYNLVLGLFKQPGVNIISDYELIPGNNKDILNITPEVNLDAQQIVFTEDMVNDRFINILLR